MLTKGDEYFVRIVLLLLRGGRFASKKKIIAEVSKLHRDLDNILQTSKDRLKYLFLNKYYEKLFPSSGKTDIEDWDLAMLTKVLLNVFAGTLEDEEKGAVETIKIIRDEMYAHSHSSTLSSDEYNEFHQKLGDAMKLLCSQLGQDIVDECDRIIAACNADKIDESLKQDLQRQLLATESLIQEVIDKLNKTENKICSHITEQSTSLKNAMREIVIEELRKFHITEDRSQKKVTVIESELTLSAPVNESQGVYLAEEIITTVINQAVEEVGDANDHPKIRLAVKKILEGIKKIPHVEIGKAEHKCVILRFKCTTYQAVLDLLLYMESEMYKTCLDELANAVSEEMFDNPFSCKLHAAVARECLTTILHELRAESSDSLQHKRTIKLPIKLQTVEGFENIWNLFEGKSALEQFQELSNAISEHLDTKITVTPSLNIDALMNSASMTIAESQTDSHADIAFIEPSEAQNQDTNFIFEYVRKTKDDDSAIGGSIITSQSNKPFSVSEGYVPAEPRLGDLIQIQMESDEIYIGRCTVGPIVSVSDTEEKCFITVGNNPGVLNKAKVHVSIDENPMRMLAWDSTYGTVLVAPDLGTQAEATALGNAMAANAEDLGDAASAHVNLSGLRVCKIGAKTKLTEGMIIGSVENMIVGGTQEALKNAVYVETLPGADDHPFASTGDAGAMVYHEKSYGSFKCIGVLLGEKIRIDAHTEYFVVRLIDDILQDFEKRLGKQITLDYSTMKEQILSTIEEQGHENLFLD